MKRRDEIINALLSVPALPVQAVNVLRLVQNPEVGVSEIMAAVEFDPGLTGNVLRLANSAYFAGPRKIGSLVEAGVLLGTRRIAQLVLTAVTLPLANKPVRGYDLPAGALVEQMAATAMGTELLAKALSIAPPTYAFTAALLHNIGKVVMGTYVEVDVESIRRLAFDEQLSFEEAEEEVLGIAHTEAGAMLLRHWNLPEEIAVVARWYRNPDGYDGEKLLVDLVHVADSLALSCGIGIGMDGLNYACSEGAVSRLNMHPAIADQVSCLMMEKLDEMKASNALQQ